jgi:hypothetical protein
MMQQQQVAKRGEEKTQRYNYTDDISDADVNTGIPLAADELIILLSLALNSIGHKLSPTAPPVDDEVSSWRIADNSGGNRKSKLVAREGGSSGLTAAPRRLSISRVPPTAPAACTRTTEETPGFSYEVCHVLAHEWGKGGEAAYDSEEVEKDVDEGYSRGPEFVICISST